MHWLLVVGIVALLAAVAALAGLEPRGARPVAHTRLLAAARWLLVVLALLLIVLGILIV